MVRKPGWMMVAAILGGAATARGQQWEWEVVFLEPVEARASAVWTVQGACQAGMFESATSDYSHPVLWHGSSANYVDLLPAGTQSGQVYALDGSTQVGRVYSHVAGFRAALWSGSAASFVSLNPGQGSGYSYTIAYAAANGQQVGEAGHSSTGYPHACMWTGTAGSFVDLHPSGAQWSEAFATDGEYQGGWAVFPATGALDAVLWHGTAASFVSMNPSGADNSVIKGMAPGAQVGYAMFGSTEHAIVWRGTPDSAVDLRPANSLNSRAYCTTGTIHGGYISWTGWAEAGIWMGDNPQSFINLHNELGPGWLASVVYGVSSHNGRIEAAGSGGRDFGNQTAILWRGRLVATERPARQPHRLSLP